MRADQCSGGMWLAQERGAFTEPRYPILGRLKGETLDVPEGEEEHAEEDRAGVDGSDEG